MNNSIVALVVIVILAAGAFFLLQGKQQAPPTGGGTGGGGSGGSGAGGDSFGVPGTDASSNDVSAELDALVDSGLAAASTDAADAEYGTSAESDIASTLGDSYQ